jgi:hypothetical protein
MDLRVRENLLANLVPEIFLRVELRRVGWQEGQLDVSGDHQIAAAVIACTIDEHQMYCLANFLAEASRKIWTHSVSAVGMIE